MRGHVRKRGSKWAVVIELGRDPVTGKRRQKWHSGYATKREAESAVAGLISGVNDGTYVEPSRLTVAEWCEQWLAMQRSRLRPSTLDSYRLNLCGRVVPTLGSLPLQRLTPAHLDALYASLLSSGRRPQESTEDASEGLSARTVRYVHTVVNRALSDAVRKGLIPRNPATAADPPSASAAKAPAMKTWTGEELRAFLSHVAEDRLFAAWLVLASTGMRRGEVLGLRWQDVDLDAGRLSVVQTIIHGDGRPLVSQPKNGRPRMVALDNRTVEALRAHRKSQVEEQLSLGPAYADNGLVFCREDGAPIWPRTFSRWFGRHAKEAGLPTIRLHDVRHSWATLALQAGVHPKVAQERLGHSSIAITLDVYSHVIESMHEDAAGKVAALFA